MRFILALALAATLAGCGLMYKQDIQQGNVLEREDVEQLREGMTRRQVLVLLGSPSVTSPFHADRWDYVNTFARRGGKPTRRQLTLTFEDDRLASISGDYLDELELADDALSELEARQTDQALDPRLNPGRDDR